MCKMKEYPGLYLKARETVRLTGINPEMPGHEMLITAIVIYKVEGPELLYEKVAEEISVVPGQKPLDKKEEERHPVQQWMTEAMKSIGIDYGRRISSKVIIKVSTLKQVIQA